MWITTKENNLKKPEDKWRRTAWVTSLQQELNQKSKPGFNQRTLAQEALSQKTTLDSKIQRFKIQDSKSFIV